jgi:N6-L-threonylcarbamoyladenine synthase
MQAHALTPRLVSALDLPPTTSTLEPEFPFLSVLASGGHTLLIQSLSLTDHHLLGTTNDIAVGEYLDKVARILLPTEMLNTTKSTMYGALLEQFAFAQHEHEDTDAQGHKNDSTMSAPQPNTSIGASGYPAKQYLKASGGDYNWYKVPPNHEEALKTSVTKWGWSLNQPLITSHGGTKINNLELSFSGLLTSVERVIRYQTDPITRKRTKIERTADEISLEEKRHIARETMRAAFEHVAYRVVLSLQSMSEDLAPRSIVLAGGVAANSFLRHILASTLCARGYHDIKLYFPPPSYCTDNAAMIAWTGLEMFEAGHTDPLSIRAIRKWPLDQLLNPIVDG